ncbi:MAG: Gfo/Idh/MocA family oxidoreductase [bacterium]
MPVKVGVIGCGKVAQRLHLPQYLNTETLKIAGGPSRLLWLCETPVDAELVGLCDIKEDLVKDIASQIGVKKVYTDYRKLLENDEIEAVSICTPNYLHAEMTIAAANAGKHVLVEKPMATSLDEARAMVEAARKNKIFLMVEQTHRFGPNPEIVKEVIDEGLIGKIFYVWGRIGHAGPEQWSPGADWFLQKRTCGGGAMIGIGVHIYDLMRFLLGKDAVEVSGTMGPMRPPYFEVESSAVAHVKFNDGTLGAFEASWSTRPYQMIVILYGEKGTMTLSFGAESPVVVQYGMPTGVGDPNCGWGTFIPARRSKSKTGGPIAYFIDCIKNNIQPSISGEEGMKTLEGVLAVYESSSTGKNVKLTSKM